MKRWRDCGRSVGVALSVGMGIAVACSVPEPEPTESVAKTAAPAPITMVKGRILVLVDTSGSMLWGFSNTSTQYGDSDASARFCDNAIGTSFDCQDTVDGAPAECTAANGAVSQYVSTPNVSRMAATKAALQRVLLAHSGLVDFGLERFAAWDGCNNPTYCCRPATGSSTRGRCNATSGLTAYARIVAGQDRYITYSGTGCGNDGPDTGHLLVAPGVGSGAQVFRWIDYVENFCDDGTGKPRNPELRANGSTPLAGSVTTARTDWYQPIYDASKGSPDPADPLYDSRIDCRPYTLVVMSDGQDNCAGDPSDEVSLLYDINAANPVRTYVLGMGLPAGLDVNELNAMAREGVGDDAAEYIPANSQQEIEEAFADIVASSIRVEVCNGLDDNCNDLIDEGMGVWQECTAAAQCESGTCDHGRCTCATVEDCAPRFACSGGFCRPSCTAGEGACENPGITRCLSPTESACCADDGAGTCTPLQAGTGSDEVCNHLDDDCDGLVDEDEQGDPLDCDCTPRPEECNGVDDDCDALVDADDPDLLDVGQPCGSHIGICEPGLTACVDGRIVCEGGVPPEPTEICNGLDDDCDGAIDGMAERCWTGVPAERGVGACVDGEQECTATPGSGVEAWGECIGEVGPTDEICNEIDDDCNGAIDDGISDGLGHSTGEECCPFVQGCSDDETIQCDAGTYECVGDVVECVNAVGPSDEICDGIDNDCDGLVDNMPGIGVTCIPSTDCGGEFQCIPEEAVDGALTCVPTGSGSPEICNGRDDDCDGDVDSADPDLAENDDRIGTPCDEPPEGQDEPPCQPGTWVCSSVLGRLVCEGSVQPGFEVCDGEDNDCDGTPDNDVCDELTDCINVYDEWLCAPPCSSGEFPCGGGEACFSGHCVPSELLERGGTGGAGGANARAGSGSDDEPGGATSSASGGTGPGGASSSSVAGAHGTGEGTGGIEPDEDPDPAPSHQWGLSTGGGGIRCAISPVRTGGWSALFGIALAGAVALRRRGGRR
ncbi:MAG: hypothetical protein JW751_30030 [Polyangiaceae bacterium]|nr:hypothetical protein [Polyangiaceae bacterium]